MTLRAALIAMLFGLLAACKTGGEEPDELAAAALPKRLQSDGTLKLTPADRAAIGLEVAPASEGDLPEVAVRLGRVVTRPGDEAVVVSPVLGRIPTAPPFIRGAKVEVGATIVQVVPLLSAGEHVSLGLHGADLLGQIEATRAELVKLDAEADRARDLAGYGAASTAKLQEALTAVATAKARLHALEQGRGLQARGESAGVLLRAPVAGIVVTLEAAVGAVVQPGQVLARILQPAPRWIDVSVPPEEPAGQRYEVAVGSSWQPAPLLSRGAVVEQDGTRHDRLEMNAAGLLPGATVAVRVGMRSIRGVVLPESALVPGVGNDLAYVETTPGTFEARPVRVAARLDGLARLASGVRVGEKVVVQGAMALRGENLRSVLQPQE